MKAVFAGTFAGLMLLSLLAWKLSPKVEDKLIWCTDDNPLRRAQIDPFNKLNPKYKLQLDPGNAGIEKVLVQALGGVGPDLFDCYNAFELAAYVRAGIAWDVTDELRKRHIDVAGETWSAVHPDCMFDGRTFGFPTNAAANAIWFHKNILAQAGITLPAGSWTWDELLPIAQKLTVRNEEGRTTQYGLLLDWENNYLQFILQWGGHMYSADGTRCTLDSPEAIAAIQFMHDLIYKYQVCPSPSAESSFASAGGWGGGKLTSITLFGAKKGAMALGGRYWLCRLRDPDFRDLQLGAAQCPYGKVPVFLGYGRATLINKNSPRREDALAFFEYLHSESYNKLINHQADGIGPLISSVQDDDFLHDPAYPQEDYNAVWRDMMKQTIPEQVSPFINGAVAFRFVKRQLDMVRANEKPVAAALHDAADQINAQIQDGLKLNPDLKRKYENAILTASPGTPGEGRGEGIHR